MVSHGELLRRVFVKIEIEKVCLIQSLQEKGVSDWERIKNFLEYVGFEPKFIYTVITHESALAERPNIIQFAAWKQYHPEKTRERLTLQQTSRIVQLRNTATMIKNKNAACGRC